jgi:hypothetical protein
MVVWLTFHEFSNSPGSPHPCRPPVVFFQHFKGIISTISFNDKNEEEIIKTGPITSGILTEVYDVQVELIRHTGTYWSKYFECSIV